MTVLAEESAQLFGVLSHPVRVQVLELLASGPVSLRDMQTQLADDGPRLGPQLVALRRAGLVVPCPRRGRTVKYGLADHSVMTLLADARGVLTHRLDARERLLAALGAGSPSLASAPVPDADQELL